MTAAVLESATRGGRLRFLCFLQRSLGDTAGLPAPPGVTLSLHAADRPRYAEIVELLSAPHLVVEGLAAGVHACGMFTRARALAHVQWNLDRPAGAAELTTAWKLVAELGRRAGALAVFDAIALRWHAAQDLPGEEAGLALGRELKLETWSPAGPLVEGARGEPTLLRSRGMAKFGQPDLLLAGPAGGAGGLALARSLLLGVADRLVGRPRLRPGDALELPGWRIEVRTPWDLPERLALTHRDAVRLVPVEAPLPEEPARAAPRAPRRGARRRGASRRARMLRG